MEDIVNEFGENVARLVGGVTKVTKLRLKGRKEEVFVENLRTMLLVMAKDLRVVALKLADRLHNMRTISALPPKSQKENAGETLEIYAPLAGRLGMGEIKGELEDLAFACIYPKEHKKVKRESAPHFRLADKHIERMKRKILSSFAKEGIKAKVHGRRKHLYSLWKKLERPGVDWDWGKTYDIVALRIITNKVSECYAALGLVHACYKPVPHLGVSDFIAQPKPNGYRSIHTKVFGPKGRIVEVQIRTSEMHEQAEYGLAAHWYYSDVKRQGVMHDKVLEVRGTFVPRGKLSWIKQLVEWQKEMVDSKEFLKAVKFDAFGHRNFVFSPKGDVYDLPGGSTPVDFAYAVHTDMGKYIKAAKVNDKIVPLDYKLKSGDVVEIIKTKMEKLPSERWLDFVVTRVARSKISGYLRKRRKKG